MNKTLSIIFGLALIAFGVLALAGNLVLPLIFAALGLGVALTGIALLWPLLVVGVGLAFILPPILNPRRPGLSGLFVPGLPILTTGGILFTANLTGQWGLWQYLWPLEVLAVAAAFVLMAYSLRNIWLLIPAILIGLNGLVLQFCAFTGLWQAWAALWTVEPLAIGLILLLVAYKTQARAVLVVGLSFCAFALLAFAGMSFLAVGGWLVRLAGPALLILVGVLLLATNLVVNRPAVKAQ
jgi:hypothetical protein